MGIPVGTKEINLELRYSAINITKNLTTDDIAIAIPYQIGFKDDNQNWVSTSAGTIELTGDAAQVLFGITAADVQEAETSPVGLVINKIAYGIVSKQIPITATILVQAIATTDSNVPAPEQIQVLIKKNDTVIGTWSLQAGTPTNELPVVIGATLEFTANGFEPIIQTVPLLRGQYTTSLTFSPNQQSNDNAGDSPIVDDGGTPTDPVDDADTPPSDGNNGTT